jgi:hypothetical protein
VSWNLDKKRLEKEIQDLNKTEAQVRLSLGTIRYDSNNEMDRLLNLRKQAAEQETLNFQSMDKKYTKITKANGDQTYDLLSHNAIKLLSILFTNFIDKNSPERVLSL